MTRPYYWLGAFFVLFSAFCFALKGIFIKLAFRYEIDAISLLTLRMGLSFPIYAVIAFRLSSREKSVKWTPKQWFWVAVLGITGYYLASFFNFEAFNYITASLERILLFIYPTFVLLINAFFRKKPITKLQMLALGLTYSGILLAFLQNTDAGQQKDLFWGSFWVILSGLVYALYLVGSDKIIPQVGPRKFTVYALMSATVPTVLHCFVVNNLHIWHYPAEVYWIGIIMALFVTVLPTFAITEGIKRVGSGNASIIASIGPIFTIFLATTILDESISLLQILGTLLVLAGVFLIGWKGTN
jgi:drug/metabolite transporter (DMT)-like permease